MLFFRSKGIAKKAYSKRKLLVPTDISDWLIFDPLAEGGVEVTVSLTYSAGIIAVCLGDVLGDGDEETFCHTLIHDLQPPIQNLSHSCPSHF